MRVAISFLLVPFLLAVTGCEDHSDAAPARDTSPISMGAPLVNAADIKEINEGFSTDASAPWGFAHDGIDFFPNGEGAPFQAVADGTITEVEYRQNDITGHWQVNLTLRYNDAFAVIYKFEPNSPDASDGQQQLDSIAVATGQTVVTGDLLGTLHAPVQGAHVHFELTRFGTPVCPEPWLTAEADATILAILRARYPAWNLCY